MDEKKERRPAYIRQGDEPPPETDWKEVYEAESAEEEKPKGLLDNDLAKIGCGCFLPALAMMGSCAGGAANAPVSPDLAASYVAGGVLGGMILCWAPLFLFWLRDQSKWIIVFSFIAVAAVFAVANFAKVGNQMQRIRDDFSVIEKVEFDKDGSAKLDETVGSKGPFAAMLVDMVKSRDAIFAEYEAERSRLRLHEMFFADKLTRNPAILENCSSILSLDPKIEQLRTRSKALVEQMGSKIEAMDYGEDAKVEMRRGYENEKGRTLAVTDRTWDIQKSSTRPLFEACKTLARRRWTARGDTFVFSNNEDMAALNRNIATLNRLDAEAAALLKEQGDRMRAKRDDTMKLINGTATN